MGKTTRRRRIARLALATGSLALLAGACAATETGDPGGSGPDDPIEVQTVAFLQPFDACEDLFTYVKQAALARVGPYGLNGDQGYPMAVEDFSAAGRAENQTATADAKTAAPAPTTAPGQESSSPSYSETNVQEAGVDEPDIVKTDGRRLLTLRDGELVIVDVSSGAPTLAGRLPLPDLAGASMFLAGDRVLVMSPDDRMDAMVGRTSSVEDRASTYRATPGTWVRLIDIADAAHPKIVDTVHIEGAFVDARATGEGVARLVVTAAPAPLPFMYPSMSDPASLQAATEANKAVIERSTLDQWIPHYRRGEPGTDGTATGEQKPLLDCAAVRHPTTFSGYDTLAVLTVSLSGSTIEPRDGTGVLASGQTVYASEQTLYVAVPWVTGEEPKTPGTTPPGSTPGTAPGTTAPPATTTTIATTTTATTATTTPPGTTPGSTPTTVAPVAPAPTVTAAPDVPAGPAGPDAGSSGSSGSSSSPSPGAPSPAPSPAPSLPPEQMTAIHQFSISGAGPAQYRTSGLVKGTLLSQFALSEQGPTLRVATTRMSTNDSAVSTMQVSDGELKVIGEVGGLGKNEQIKSVRFLGDRGYVVTFRRIDPLYVIDLSNPSAPRMAGELKIPGYSAYLHPVDANLLIGVGQDGTDRGQTTGTKVSLFDVSDPAQPREIQSHVLPGAWSEAEQDHHAFLWWPATNLALLPVTQQTTNVAPSCPPNAECMPQTTTTGFNGALGLTVTPGGISEAGRIVSPWTGWTTGDTGPSCPDDACSFPFTTPIDRLVVIGDHIFSVSTAGVLASDLHTLQPGPWLSLGA